MLFAAPGPESHKKHYIMYIAKLCTGNIVTNN